MHDSVNLVRLVTLVPTGNLHRLLQWPVSLPVCGPVSALSSLLIKDHTCGLPPLQLSHVMADPVQRAEMSHVDLSEFKCAIVLCDERWMDPDMDDTNGIDTLDQPSVLRLDATMMVVQVR